MPTGLYAAGYCVSLSVVFTNVFMAIMSVIQTCLIFISDNITNLAEYHKWIIQRVNQTIQEQHKFIEIYDFMSATQSIYKLFLNDFCDNFIEVIKHQNSNELDKNTSIGSDTVISLDNAVLYYSFISIIRMLNPFMPFITEEIHHKLESEVIRNYPIVILESQRNIDGSTLTVECTDVLRNNFQDTLAMVKMIRSKCTSFRDGTLEIFFADNGLPMDIIRNLLKKEEKVKIFLERRNNTEEYQKQGEIEYRMKE